MPKSDSVAGSRIEPIALLHLSRSGLRPALPNGHEAETRPRRRQNLADFLVRGLIPVTKFEVPFGRESDGTMLSVIVGFGILYQVQRAQ